MVRSFARFLTALALCATPSFADEIAGKIRVIDADTIDVGDTRVRLFGIDAPEVAQSCAMPDGTDWVCGRWATGEVTRLYGGKDAMCTPRDIDRYGRVVAVCFVDGVDIAEALVLAGIAFPYELYSLDYVDASKIALFREVGLWRSRAVNPADFRAMVRARAASPAPDPACPIKGNISQSGKIYHVPGNADYEATQINVAKGERWFCSAAEAEAEGWRAAKR